MAIVCALPIELAAVQVVFDEEHPLRPSDSGDPNQYAFGRIGNHNVVVACLPMGVYGQTSTAVVVSQLRRSYNHITRVALVGVGSGCPNAKRDVRLGDVVVSVQQGVAHLDLPSLQQGELKQNSFLPRPGDWWTGPLTALEAKRLLQNVELAWNSRFEENSRKRFWAPSTAVKWLLHLCLGN